MGTIHRLNWDRKRPFRKRPPGKRSLRASDLFLFFGVSLLAAAIVANSLGLLRETSPRRLPIGLQVIDGDSLKVDGENIRLTGIDAPELHQTCHDGQEREWPCGKAAKARLAELVSKGQVTCAAHRRDIFGRTLAVCSVGDIPDLGEVLVREGFAVSYARKPGDGYVAAEIQSRLSRRGLWQGEFENPWDWRRRHPRAG
jgi:endonuclease YncB( thermonuclease family)